MGCSNANEILTKENKHNKIKIHKLNHIKQIKSPKLTAKNTNNKEDTLSQRNIHHKNESINNTEKEQQHNITYNINTNNDIMQSIPSQYTLETFKIKEKIIDYFTYKKFKVINTLTQQYHIMIVISLEYLIPIDYIQYLIKIKHHKNIVNIHQYFTDDYFLYLIVDYTYYNIYDAVFMYSSFTLEKLKKIIRNLLLGIKYLNDNHIVINYFDYRKIYINSESGEMKLEYFDIDELIEKNINDNNITITTTNNNEKYVARMSLNDIIHELAKILIILLTEKEIPFRLFDSDIDDVIDRAIIPKGEIKDFISFLLNFNTDLNHTIVDILKQPFLSQSNLLFNNFCLKMDSCFSNVYIKYNLYKCTVHYLKYPQYYRENASYFKSLYSTFEDERKEIKMYKLASEIRTKMKNKFISFELSELIAYISNMNITFFNDEHFIKVLIGYETNISKNALKKAFYLVDSKRTGKIRVTELRKIFEMDEEHSSKELSKEIQNLLNEVSSIQKHYDNNDERAITFNEFLYILMNLY